MPIVGGLALGVLMVFVRPAMRLPVGAILTVAIGAMATFVSGEYLMSWAFILIDVPLVGISAVAGFLTCRNALRLGRSPGGEA